MKGFIFLVGFDEIGDEMIVFEIVFVNLLDVVEKWTYFEEFTVELKQFLGLYFMGKNPMHFKRYFIYNFSEIKIHRFLTDGSFMLLLIDPLQKFIQITNNSFKSSNLVILLNVCKGLSNVTRCPHLTFPERNILSELSLSIFSQ